MKRTERKERTTMNRCIVCGENIANHSFFSLREMPASAQDLSDHESLDKNEGVSLSLCQYPKCGLVQFDCEPVSYYRDVIRAGGFSTTMVELRRAQYRHLIETFHLEGRRFLEVGCGRGEFLSVLTEFPVSAYGITCGNCAQKRVAGDGGFRRTRRTSPAERTV